MGSVYRAWDPKLHREVALKLLRPDLASGPKARERFHREARAIAALRHPNIVEIYDYSGEDSEHLYLVMERLTGDDLFNIMNRRGPLPEPVVAAIGHELCLALGVAHTAGVIHRDLKPENVFLDGAGRVVLTDFGVVKAVRENSAVGGYSTQTDVIGTPGFMAPELMTAKALGPFTDVFSLGALLYNIATGEMPFEGDVPVEVHKNMLAERISDPKQFAPGMSSELCACLEACLKADPKRRPASAEVLRESLKGVLELHGVTDLRDDLRDYVNDAEAYAKASRRRELTHLIKQLKLALRDKDSATAAALQRRLLVLDPTGQAPALDGVLGLAKERADTWRPRRLTSGSTSFYLVAGGLAGLAVGLAAFFAWRAPGGEGGVEGLKPVPAQAAGPAPGQGGASGTGAAPPSIPAGAPATEPASPAPAPSPSSPPAAAPPQPAGVTPPPAPEVRPAVVVLRWKGGQGQASLDGQRLGKVDMRGKKVAPGEHNLEVVARGKRLVRKLELAAGARLTVTVDVKRGKITVR